MMGGDFYITIFSNTSQKSYPYNSTSKFTVSLPRPIKLINSEYRVGITQCHHPALIGTVNSEKGDDQDCIIFPNIVSEQSFTYDLDTLTSLILKNSSRPELYTKRYFHEFLSKDNLKDFDVNDVLKKYRTKIPKGAHKFKITPYDIALQYRVSLEDRDYVEFQTNFKYTGKQILYIILNTYYRILLEDNGTKYGIIVEKNKSISDMLYLYAVTFVNSIRAAAIRYASAEISNYLLIYSDIVEPSIVGNAMSRILYVAPRQSDVNRDTVEIRNVRYERVSKSVVNDISFLFTDENGRQLIFQDGYLPTLLTLHFYLP